MKKLLFTFLLFTFTLLLFTACDNSHADTNNSESIKEEQTALYVLKTYSLTDEYGNAGTYTEINSKHNAGEDIELEATVKSGYNFVGWFINNTCISEDLNYTFNMKSSNVEIEARYDYYTVSTSSYSDDYQKAGIYTELKSKKISIGEQVTVEATVNAGYNFEGWYIDSICVSENLLYSFTMKDRNVGLEARWSYYTVTVESYTDEQGTAGVFTKKDDEKVSIGETVSLTATVNKGFNFEGWYIDGICVSSELTYQFLMGKSNKTINAQYSYYTFSSYGIVAKSGWLYDTPIENTIGTCTSYNYQKITNGDTVKLKATVYNGYTFEGWYLDGICISTDYEYTYTMTKENVALVARYSYYTLDVCAYDHTTSQIYYTDDIGNVSFYESVKVQVGETITLTAIGKNGYRFVGWTHGFGGITVSTNSTYTFVMGATDE
ncbi:MAG: InlB B-repeat-containing protein, partial [Clostridia bacterium]|nr:InlB B-repeat-containing protein [Clostridia bacterium]